MKKEVRNDQVKLGLKLFVLYLALFAIFYVVYICLSASLSSLLLRFDCVDSIGATYIKFVVPLVLALVTCAVILNNKMLEKAKTVFIYRWPYICVPYFLLVICLVAVSDEMFMDENHIEKLLELEWLIFGISIAVFVVWQSVTVKKKKDFSRVESEGLKKYLEASAILAEKERRAQYLPTLFFFIINIVLLCATTSYIMLVNTTSPYAKQVVVTITFYVCTNTIMSLVLDVVRNLRHKGNKDRLQDLLAQKRQGIKEFVQETLNSSEQTETGKDSQHIKEQKGYSLEQAEQCVYEYLESRIDDLI